VRVRLIGYNESIPEYHDQLKPPNPASRTFHLPLGRVSGTQGFGFRYGDLIVRGDGRIVFGSPYLIMQGNAPRLYVYDAARIKRWKNVEITVEYMRVSEDNPPSYAGLGIGARSIHELSSQQSKVPTYYLKHTFDGRFFFEKEWIHGSQDTKQPNSQDKSYPFPKNVWMSILFRIFENRLEGFQWRINDWVLVRSYTDTGTWDGNAPIIDGTSCFIRTDNVTDFRIRKFSICEII